MDCCQAGLADEFNQRTAERQLARYRSHGPERTTSMLLDALLSRGVSGLTALDIGGGVGALTLGMLRAGAAQAAGVDVSAAYVAAATAEAARQGLAQRVSHRQGDAVALAAELAPADIVTLDRVICCYPDMPALLGVAANRAQRFVGLVYPRDTWWVRAGRRLVNAACWAQRTAFRLFIHRSAAVDAVLRGAGLSQVHHAESGIWQVALYARAAEPGA